MNFSKNNHLFRFIKTLANGSEGGSTNFIYLLKSLYLSIDPTSEEVLKKNIILFTDGNITEVEKTFLLIQQYNETLNTKIRYEKFTKIITGKFVLNFLRIFTFGVGSDMNRHFISTVSRISGGISEYLPASVQSTQRVHNLLEKSSQECFENIRVDFFPNPELSAKSMKSPKFISSLYNGERQLVYAFVENLVTHATLAAQLPNGEKVEEISMNFF